MSPFSAKRVRLGWPLLPIAAVILTSCRSGHQDVNIPTPPRSGRHLLYTEADLAKAPAFTVESTPKSVIGGASVPVDYDLTMLQTVVLLSGGQLITWAQWQPKLLAFGADGTPEKAIGRSGGGPGEFAWPEAVALIHGDTVLVVDHGNARLNWVTLHDGIVRMEQLKPSGLADGFEVGRLDDGRELRLRGFGLEGIDSSRAPFLRDSALVMVVSFSGSIDTIAKVVGQEIRVYDPPRGPHYGFGRRVLARPWDSLIVMVPADQDRIEFRDWSGRILTTVEFAGGRRPVTPAMRRARIAKQLSALDEQVGGGDGATAINVDPAAAMRRAREEIETQGFADSLPAVDAVFPIPGGDLWVLRGWAPSDSEWSAIRVKRDGSLAAVLRARNIGYPVAIGDSLVVVKEKDDDGVIRLEVFRIRKQD